MNGKKISFEIEINCFEKFLLTTSGKFNKLSERILQDTEIESLIQIYERMCDVQIEFKAFQLFLVSIGKENFQEKIYVEIEFCEKGNFKKFKTWARKLNPEFGL